MQKIIASLLSVVSSIVFLVFGTNQAEIKIVDEPQKIVVFNNLQTEKPPLTTTSTVKISKNALCPMYWNLAVTVGWQLSELEKLDSVMWRESRCNSFAYNAGDPNGGSHGLMQINGFWCKKSRYSQKGFLQDLGIVEICSDIYQPEIALKSALALFKYSFERNGNGWSPWNQ